MTDAVFRSGRCRATVVRWLFSACIVTQLFYGGALLAEIALLRRIGADAPWAQADTAPLDLAMGVATVVYGMVFAAGALAFLIWLYRVRANLPALGINDARWGPAWAVGWWFVPLMNYVVPFLVVRDLWKASGPEAGKDDWRSLPTPALLWAWWASWLIGGWAGCIFWGLSLKAPQTVADLIDASIADGVNTALVTLSTLLAVRIVTGLDRRQAERHAALSGGG